MKILSTLAVAAVLAVGIATVSPATSSAAYGDSSLACRDLSGLAQISLPNGASPRMSIYAYSIDGGSWRYSPWYFMSGTSNYYYDGAQRRWIGIPLGSIANTPVFNLGPRHHVQAWEARYDTAGRFVGWVNLGACTTSTADSAGWMVIVP